MCCALRGVCGLVAGGPHLGTCMPGSCRPPLTLWRCVCVRVLACACLCACRPRRLLVFVNPFGGSKRAGQIWESVVRPVFDKAGIRSAAVHTKHGGHARSLLTGEGGWVGG